MKMRTRVEACSVLVFFFDFFLDLQTFYVFAFQVSFKFWTLWKLQKFCHLRSIRLFETDIKVVTGGPKCPTNCLLIDRISQFLISLLPKIPQKKLFARRPKLHRSLWNCSTDQIPFTFHLMSKYFCVGCF